MKQRQINRQTGQQEQSFNQAISAANFAAAIAAMQSGSLTTDDSGLPGQWIADTGGGEGGTEPIFARYMEWGDEWGDPNTIWYHTSYGSS